MSDRVVVAGGSGFIGHHLQKLLKDAGYEVAVLSRSKPDQGWDGKSLGKWTELIDGATAVVNLVGESIAQPWTPESKKRIVDSRVESTAILGQAIASSVAQPAVWLNGSAVGFYGERGDELLTESSPAGEPNDFLVETCLKWERAQTEAPGVQSRLVQLRTGFVLGMDGGALPLLVKLTRGFLGGAVGNGKQWIPWVHVHDLARLILFAIDSKVEGPLNGSAPHPVTNDELMSSLRKQLGRPWSPPAPSIALSIAKAFGGPEPELALISTKAIPEKALAHHFTFDFPNLETALQSLLSK